MKNLFRLSEHSFIHLLICGVMMLSLLVNWLLLAWYLPLVANLRPMALPITPVQRYTWSGIFLVGGGLLYGLVYAYLGYTFYLPYRHFLNFGRAMLLWPLLWWLPVFCFCEKGLVRSVIFTVAVGNPHDPHQEPEEGILHEEEIERMLALTRG